MEMNMKKLSVRSQMQNSKLKFSLNIEALLHCLTVCPGLWLCLHASVQQLQEKSPPRHSRGSSSPETHSPGYLRAAPMLSLLTPQMKELGVVFYNCSCLVLDLQRIFALYSSLKFKNRVPQTWSKRLYGVYDNEKKLQLQLNETKSQAFVSVSPCLLLLPPPQLERPGVMRPWANLSSEDHPCPPLKR